jgi:hypothetical protein
MASSKVICLMASRSISSPSGRVLGALFMLRIKGVDLLLVTHFPDGSACLDIFGKEIFMN